MATRVKTGKLVQTLYRSSLKTARLYGEGAQRRQLPAKKELEKMNSLLKHEKIVLRSGMMTPELATTLVQQMFRQHAELTNPEQIGLAIEDAFVVLKRMQNKAEVLRIFPFRSFSEQITNGCKISARSQFLFERAGGWVFYEYAVKVTNLTEDKHLQLVTEELDTIDENVQKRKVKSALRSSIKTKIPILPPGESFEFSKKYPLRTRTGSISGKYLLLDTSSGQILEAQMAPFLLSDAEHLGHESESSSNLKSNHRSSLEAVEISRNLIRSQDDSKEIMVTTEDTTLDEQGQRQRNELQAEGKRPGTKVGARSRRKSFQQRRTPKGIRDNLQQRKSGNKSSPKEKSDREYTSEILEDSTKPKENGERNPSTSEKERIDSQIIKVRPKTDDSSYP